MNKTKMRLVTAASVGAIFFSSITSVAFAGTSTNIYGNGSNSDNSVRYSSSHSTNLSQDNKADFRNDLKVSSNSGGNTANRNTGGDVSIMTGDSSSDVAIHNMANLNHLNMEGCGDCGHWGADINISGNGSNSDNRVNVDKNSTTRINQNNWARFNNMINSWNSTGNNRAHDNTGGDVSIKTEDAHSSTHVSNMANMNHVNIGGSNEGNGGNGGNGSMNMFGHKLHAFMNGSQEVPHSGDPDGWGRAKVWFTSNDQMCVDLKVKNIDTASAAHIHEAPRGVAGPVVISLPTPDSNGHSSGCMTVESGELMEIKNNPSNYYVNVHNAAYPHGAVRGQLSR